MMRGTFKASLCALSLALLYFFGILVDASLFLIHKVVPKPTIFILEPGYGLSSFATYLKKEDALSHPVYIRLLNHLIAKSIKIQAGEYALKKDMRVYEILHLFMQGQVIQHRLSLIEGWRLETALEAIKNDPYLKKTDFDLELLAQKYQVGLSFEGLLFPDTYFFPLHFSDEAFFKRAYLRQKAILSEEWTKRAPNLPYDNPYQALIIASLIEKETAINAEKYLIAGVILNRLQKNMRLQIDPTVIYALGSLYQGKLNKSDLQIDSPYNTYRYKGLPPTPIALVSLSSLRAALHPEMTAYFYYLAKGDGSHVFSETLAEQNKAVKVYLKKE